MKKNMRLYKMGVFFRKFILYFILLFFALLWLIPFFFLVMGSFKSTSELFQVPFRWLPKHFDFDNYINMFQQIPFLRYLKNTLIIVFFSVVGALISNSLIAYGFSRLRWPGRDKVFIFRKIYNNVKYNCRNACTHNLKCNGYVFVCSELVIEQRYD